jgi:CubicO group peptidase (beta-lactamase class C family)
MMSSLKAVVDNIFLLLLFSCLSIGAVSEQNDKNQIKADQHHPAKIVLSLKGDTLVSAQVSGYADIQQSVLADMDTAFYLGSISKIFTSVLVLHLVEQQQLVLTDEIRQLLSHSSGLPREGDFGYWFSAEFPGSVELKQYLSSAPLLFEPGKKYHYSNIAYAKLGLIIEEATGLSYAQALNRYVLAPLGMTHTGVRPYPAHIAQGYSPENRILPNAQRPFAGIGAKVGQRHLRVYHDAKAMSPAFGIFSTPRDMSVFLGFLSGAKNTSVLNKASLAGMYRDQGFGRTLGLKRDKIDGVSVLRHDGWFAAHRSHLLFDPLSKRSVIALTNFDDSKPALLAETAFRKL